MIRRLLCRLVGHGPWRLVRSDSGVWHDGELRRARWCGYCGACELLEVDG